MSGSLPKQPSRTTACDRRGGRLQVVVSSIRRLECDAATSAVAGGRGAALSRPALGQQPSLAPVAGAARMPTGPQPIAARHRSQLLEELLRTNGRCLRHQAFRHSESAEAAEEALQEAAVQFLRCFEGVSVDHAVRWMMTTVKRCAWAITREARRRQPLILSSTDTNDRAEQSFIARDASPGPEELAERHDEHAETIHAFERLKPDERTALLMLGLGCSYREIQDRRGWTRTKVNRCLAEGREAMRAERGPSDGR
jgi:RNA polymerase sigma factor (sigma-70 family)